MADVQPLTNNAVVLVNQTPLWFQAVQATAAVATTVGVLIALYIAVIREPRKAVEERAHHKAQIDALQRAERERVAAQARKVVSSCVRTPMFGDSWWTVRIDKASNAVTTILDVDVKALDGNRIEVPDGCRQANNTLPVDQAFDRSIRAALSRSVEGGMASGVSQHLYSHRPRHLGKRCETLSPVTSSTSGSAPYRPISTR